MIVAYADWIADAFRAIQDGFRDADGKMRTFYDVFQLPPRSEWLTLYYRRHSIFLHALPVVGITDGASELYHAVRSMSVQAKRNPERLKQEVDELLKENPDFCQDIFSSLRKDQGEMAESLLREDGPATPEQTQYYATPQMLFVFRVILPCFILYNTLPSMLLLRARGGNVNAICNLLKIDKSLIYDKKISTVIYRIQALQPALFRNRIAKALAAPLPKISRKKLKNNLAGFAWAVFGDFFQLSTADIHACFDSHAQAVKGQSIDPDIQIDEEAHRKALARYSKDWKENYLRLNPDKKAP